MASKIPEYVERFKRSKQMVPLINRVTECYSESKINIAHPDIVAIALQVYLQRCSRGSLEYARNSLYLWLTPTSGPSLELPLSLERLQTIKKSTINRSRELLEQV